MNDFLRRVHDDLHRGDRKRPWLAERAGVSLSTLNGWFKNDRIPRADEATRVARVLGRTVEYLVTGQEPTTKQMPPELADLCQLLEGLSKEQLAELRGVVKSYVQQNFGSARASKAAGA